MHLIATHVDDSIAELRAKLAADSAQPERAMDPYFYRSHHSTSRSVNVSKISANVS